MTRTPVTDLAPGDIISSNEFGARYTVTEVRRPSSDVVFIKAVSDTDIMVTMFSAVASFIRH